MGWMSLIWGKQLSRKPACLWKTENFHGFYQMFIQAVQLLQDMKKAARWAVVDPDSAARGFRSGVRIAAEESSLSDWGA